MKAKLVKESLYEDNMMGLGMSGEQKEKQNWGGEPQSVEHFDWIPNESTIDDFFTWYASTPEWGEDWQIANTMSVNDDHAQDDGHDGMSHIMNLWDNKYDKISIESNQFRPGDWNLEFKHQGDVYSIQSAVKAFDETDDY